MTNQAEYTAVYLGKLEHYTRDDQLADCRKIAKMFKLPPIGRRVYEHDELEEFISSLRGNECALVATLESLAGKRGRGVSRRFYNNIERVKDGAHHLMDANTQLCSDDGHHWYTYREKVAGSLINGRKLSSDKAASMAELSHAKPSIVKHWRNLEGTPKYIKAAKVWSNMSIKPQELAHGNMPYKALRETSISNIRRIFGSRAECGIRLNTYLKTKES